jgi:molybdopterin-containing oxidoreductase family iron-sulfur binding subunit
MPEPITTRMWGPWAELNPKTAEKMNISEGDLLRLESGTGAVELPAFIYPGIGPDTVAVPFGYGHKSFGKFATGRGANIMDLLGGLTVNGTGALAWRSVRVRITKTGKKVETARAAHPKGEYVGEVFQL